MVQAVNNLDQDDMLAVVASLASLDPRRRLRPGDKSFGLARRASSVFPPEAKRP